MRTKHLSLPPLCLLLLLAACLGLGLNSCTNDLPDLEQPAGPGTDADDTTPLRPEDYVGRPVSFSGFTVTEVTTDAATRAVTRSSTAPFGKPGDVVTIKMRAESLESNFTIHLADYVLSQDCTSLVPVSDEQNKPLYWQEVNNTHYFTAYYPALTDEEKAKKDRTDILLPLDWTEDDYRKYGRFMQSSEDLFPIGSPVSLNLRLLLTRIEVSIDPATGITDATHLTMYTKAEGTVLPSGLAAPNRTASVEEMNLWRCTSPTDDAPDATSATPVFLGYAIPQTYAPGTLLLKHHTPDVNDARTYTVDIDPAYPDGLTTKGGEVVSFKVAAITPTTVNVDAAGELEAALKKAFPTGDYPTRLKITGELDEDDLNYLTKLTSPTTVGGSGANITAVDMEEAKAAEEAFGTFYAAHPFYSYNGSIKSLVLPSLLSTVANRAFSGSTLTSVTLPKGLKIIDSSAFADCKNLKSITLPPLVTTLGMHVFAGSGLTSIELPEGLTEVGDRAFQNCKDLQHVALSGNESITVGPNAFTDIHPSCHLFLYAPGLDATSPSIQDYLTGIWAGTTWENVHWGYKGSGSKLNPENYEHHLKVMP